MFAYLFSFHGRSGRLSYLFFFLLWVFLLIGLAFTSSVLGLISPALMEMSLIAIVIGLFISSFAITVRRLHDLDLTGWVLAFIYVVWILGGVILYFGPAYVAPDMQHLVYYSGVGIHIFVNLFYVMLLIWPGKDAFNRF